MPPSTLSSASILTETARQRLDELDGLIQRMLDLPVVQTEEVLSSFDSQADPFLPNTSGPMLEAIDEPPAHCRAASELPRNEEYEVVPSLDESTLATILTEDTSISKRPEFSLAVFPNEPGTEGWASLEPMPTALSPSATTPDSMPDRAQDSSHALGLNLIGITGVALLGGAAIWAVIERMGWTW